MKEIVLLIPFVGYLLFVRDSIRWAKRLAEKDPNPKRAKYTNLFLITISIFAIPVFMILVFLFSPTIGAFVWSGFALFFSFYVAYGLYGFLKSRLPKFKSKYKIEPITPEFKIFREPEIKISASAINKHVHVLAPTGSGKTKSIVGPVLQQAIDKGLGIMSIDPKGDNEVSLACIDLLQKQGRLNDLWYYDVMLPNYSRSYNPLYSGIKYNNPAQLGVLIIATMPKAGGAATFYEKVQSEFTRAMVRLLSLVNHTGKMANFIDLYSILAYLPYSIEYLLDTYQANAKFKDELAELWIKTIAQEAAENQNFRQFLRGLQQHLALYAFTFHPKLLNSYNPEIKIADGFRQSKLMNFSLRSLDFPSGESLDIGKMILMDLQSYAAYKTRENIQNEFPDIVIVDEAPQVIPPEFQKIFEMARGAGIGVMVLHQSTKQFDNIQKGMFENIFTNCHVKVCLGAADRETAEFYAKLLGEELKMFKTYSRGGENVWKKPIDAILPHWNELVSERYDYRVRPEDIINMPIGEGLLIVREKDLFGVRGKTYYFATKMEGKPWYYLPKIPYNNDWKDENLGLNLLSKFQREFGDRIPDEDRKAVKSKKKQIANNIEQRADKIRQELGDEMGINMVDEGIASVQNVPDELTNILGATDGML